MHIRARSVLLSLLAAVLVLTGTIVVRAATISLSGVTASDATVTDRNGQTVTSTDGFSKWEDYNVNYNWSVADDVKIQAGDTAAVELPTGLVADADLEFPIVDASGATIGTFTVKAGETSGLITFNDTLVHTTTGRKGTLHFYAKGTETGDVHFNWTINKIGWVSEKDASGVPTKLTWNIAFNPTGKNLGTVVVTDTLGPNQTYIPNSETAYVGEYDSYGMFMSDGEITPEVTVNGQQVTFTFNNVTQAVNMVYKVQLQPVSSDGGQWTNSASMDGTTVSGNVNWGGGGTGEGQGDIPDLGAVKLVKKDATTAKVLAGATYQLVTADGQVLQSGLKTDVDGELFIDELEPGTYHLIETAAPDGYQLNQEPLVFTIESGQLTPVALEQSDEPEKTVEPEKPGTTEPENPGTTEPENPGTTEPENPGTTEPEKPGTTEPENPGTTEPENPGATEPENPGTTEPENPGTTEPEKPGTTEPENPGTTEPNKPGATTPEQPSTSNSNSSSSQDTTGANGTNSIDSNQSTKTPTSSNSGSATLPQTNEQSKPWYAVLFGGVMLIGLGYVWKEKR